MNAELVKSSKPVEIIRGDYNVGKTSLIRRFNGDEFSVEPTLPGYIDVAYGHRVSDTLTKDLVVRFYDTGGMEREGNSLPTNFSRNKDGIILAWDLSDADTNRHLDQWEEEIVSNNYTDNMPAIIVIANNSDKTHNPYTYTRCVENYSKRRIDCFKKALAKLVSLMVEASLLKQGTAAGEITEVVNLEASQVDHPSEGSRGSCC